MDTEIERAFEPLTAVEQRMDTSEDQVCCGRAPRSYLDLRLLGTPHRTSYSPIRWRQPGARSATFPAASKLLTGRPQRADPTGRHSVSRLVCR